MAETEERSPWPWVVVALGLLAFIAAVVFLTRPAQLASPGDNDTVIVQPDSGRDGGGLDQRVTVEQDGREGEAPPATETAPPDSAPAPAAPANTPAPTEGTGQSAPGSPPSDSEPTPEQQALPVSVEMGEWFVRLEPATVPAGRTRFRVRNVGRVTHGFEIDGQGVQEQSERLSPGESAVVVTDLGPGEYVVYCYVGDHRQRGMETRLQVTEE